MHYKSHHFGEESNHSFAVKIENLVREIIIQNEIPYYRIESGVEHLTDAGAEQNLPVVRVITYFEDTVNKISHILHEEFDVDIEKSTDKRKIRIETFAYKNINYTARLTAARQHQTEYRRTGDKKFEIQICSMLQDAWTGIEKELGYDSASIPDEAKRDFYRVGALLEMADIEFLKIRTELSQKKQQNKAATENAAQAVKEAPKEAVDKNADSFIEHLQSVAKEAQKEPAPQAAPQQPTVNIVEEFTRVFPLQEHKSEPVQPVAQQPIYMPPVVQQPAPMQQAASPAKQPVATPPPAVHMPSPAQQPIAAHGPVTSAQHVQSIAPRRVATSQPAGIAPKPTAIPKPEAIQSRIASDISVNNLKELANSINHIENRNGTSAPRQEYVAPKEPPIVVPPATIYEQPRQAQEPIAPLAEKTFPPTPVMPVAENTGNISVNGSGFIPKTAEIAKESSLEKTMPLYGEQPKPVKAAQQIDENAQMTDITLREFVMNSKLVKEIDQKIAERAGAKINTEIDIEGDVERLRFLKVYSLKQLHDRLLDNKDDIVAFAEKWIGKDNGGSFDSGICLFYLEYLLVGKKNDPAFAVEYVVKFISDNDYSARYIIPTYNSIHNTEAPNFSHLTLRA